MFLKQLAPQGLKCATAPIHGVQFGKVSMWASVVTPLDPMGRDAGSPLRGCFYFCHTDTAIKLCNNFIETDSAQVLSSRYALRPPG
jgi:hypothetical protein